MNRIVTILLLLTSAALAQNSISLPELSPAHLNGRKLKVVCTTPIIADVVANIAKDLVELDSLIKPGQSAHAYKPTTGELVKGAEADVIFINGWNLEENLLSDLRNIVQNVPIVPVSANIEPIVKDNKPDPHSWMSLDNMIIWTKNIEKVLSTLDPANKKQYQENAARYQEKLADLKRYAETELAKIPAEKRLLISNHDAFEYFARDYGFKIPATIIPSTSALAEPSAKDLASLIKLLRDNKICTIFSETDSSDKLAKSIASELRSCDKVEVIPLHAGTFDKGSDFIEMFKDNIDKIVKGLR